MEMRNTLRQWQLAGVVRKMEQKLERWAMRLKGATANGEREGVLLDKGAN